MKKILFTIVVAVALCVYVSNANALFQPGFGTVEQDMFFDSGKTDTSFEGDIGSQNSGVHVEISTNVLADSSSGFATLKPSPKELILSDVFFTPVDGTLFGDFTFRGQLNTAGTVTVRVWDNAAFLNPQSFDFTVSKANQDFDSIGIISLDGETIYKVEIFTEGGFKEVKQMQFSNAEGISLVPEPFSLLLLGFGLVGLAGVRRFKK